MGGCPARLKKRKESLSDDWLKVQSRIDDSL